MRIYDVDSSIIGRKCRAMFAGTLVRGTITGIQEDKYSVSVIVTFDQPQNWGGEMYTTTSNSARKCDGFGSLSHLQLL